MRGAMLRAVVMVMMLVGCGAAVPKLPSQGGPEWIELTTDHFMLWTDASGDRGRELLREMERMRQIVVGVAFPGVSSSGQNLVIAVRDDDELAALSPTGEPRSFAMPANPPLWQPMFVLSAFSNRDPADRTIAHELTHVISFSVVRHQPRWLAEGMAEFFETVDLDPDSTKADIGVAPQIRGQPMQMAHLIPVEMLLTWGALSKGEHREYSTAWALFTFLINEHRTELARYMQLLDDGAPTGPGRAARLWGEAFPSLPLSSVDLTLRQWLVSGHHTVVHLNVAAQTFGIGERPLGDADALAIRGLLHSIAASRPDNDKAARADLAAALAAEPTHVLARMVGLVLDHGAASATPSIDEARAITATHASDWRAWFLASLAIHNGHGDAAELASARAKACRLIELNAALAPPDGLCPSAPAR